MIERQEEILAPCPLCAGRGYRERLVLTDRRLPLRLPAATERHKCEKCNGHGYLVVVPYPPHEESPDA